MNTTKPAQQTATRNGVTISFPVGYKDVAAYLATLRTNIKIMQKQPSKYVKLLAGYASDVAKVEQFLA